ncbi:MAG: PmoA family protein [Verrucomicrobiales bacterium]|nr:PmoA family protein [Verrucomicrobiales bacterium]
MKKVILPALLLSLYFFTPASASAQQIKGNGWTVTQQGGAWRFAYQGKLVTSYHVKSVLRPYFYPLIGPTGKGVTRKFPMKEGIANESTDHPHHRGLWFGLGKVNGIDFWHEKEGAGKIVFTGLKGIQIKNQSVTLKTGDDWIDPSSGLKIMEDRREFTLHKDPAGNLSIDATITLMATTGDVKIEDDKEGAFAIRTTPSLRLKGPVAKGHILTSEGLKDADAWGKRAKWVDYYGPDSTGSIYGIAIFDHPTSFRHPTWWHARDYGLFTANPFGQGHFEKGADPHAGDHTIKNGESLVLKYRILLHHGTPQEAKVSESYANWITQ